MRSIFRYRREIGDDCDELDSDDELSRKTEKKVLLDGRHVDGYACCIWKKRVECSCCALSLSLKNSLL